MDGSSIALVVDDEWLLRDCICAHLRDAGLRVFEARTGEAALSLLAAGERVDMLFPAAIPEAGRALLRDRPPPC